MMTIVANVLMLLSLLKNDIEFPCQDLASATRYIQVKAKIFVLKVNLYIFNSEH